jgi:hypothetical protein
MTQITLERGMSKISKPTKKQLQEQAIKDLLYEIRTAQAWFDDTSYPRQSRLSFEESLANFKKSFGVIDNG